jgi:hypothetical protein
MNGRDTRGRLTSSSGHGLGVYEIVVSVEAVGRSRRATVEWVEQMVSKHKDLPTNKLVLVAEKGFSKQARVLAESEGAVPLAPQDLTGADPTERVVGAVRSLWPKVVTFSPVEFGVNFDDADAPKDGWPGESPRCMQTTPQWWRIRSGTTSRRYIRRASLS